MQLKEALKFTNYKIECKKGKEKYYDSKKTDYCKVYETFYHVIDTDTNTTILWLRKKFYLYPKDISKNETLWDYLNINFASGTILPRTDFTFPILFTEIANLYKEQKHKTIHTTTHYELLNLRKAIQQEQNKPTQKHPLVLDTKTEEDLKDLYRIIMDTIYDIKLHSKLGILK